MITFMIGSTVPKFLGLLTDNFMNPYLCVSQRRPTFVKESLQKKTLYQEI